MNFLEKFYFKTLQYNYINKFTLKNTKKLPRLKKIILNFGCKTAEIKQLSSSLLALELISGQKGCLTATKKPNIIFKIRKGNATGCKVTLQKSIMYNFLSKLLIEILPKLKTLKNFKFNKKNKKNVFSCSIKNTFSFYELENHYYLFNTLPKLDITVFTNAANKKELKFLLKSMQITH